MYKAINHLYKDYNCITFAIKKLSDGLQKIEFNRFFKNRFARKPNLGRKNLSSQ